MVKKLKVLKYTWFVAGIYLIWKLTEYANDHKILKFLVNFFPQNFNSFSRYWDPNFGPFRAKSDSLNEIATLKANICVKNIVEVFLFSFSENMG